MVQFAAAVLLSIAPQDGLPDHPRVFLDDGEVQFISSNLDHQWFNEAWKITRDLANNPRGPDIDQNWCFTDGPALYDTDLNVDTRDVMSFAFAYALNGDTKYITAAEGHLDNIVARVDVSYKSGLTTWEAIFWDLLGIRMVISLDLLWNGLDATRRDQYVQWMGTLAGSVRTLHTKETNGGYYKNHCCANNIKSWDNALIGMTGYLLGDPELIAYALHDPANTRDRSGKQILMHYRSQIRNAIVEETSGSNSQYGIYRTVDWNRANEDNKDYNESVGYAAYHQQALEMLMRPALRHGLDLYRVAARAEGGEGRHHPKQPVARTSLFTSLSVPAVDNEWRTWNGSSWIYDQQNDYHAATNGLKAAGFVNEVTSPDLDLYRQRLTETIEDGLVRSGEYYADWHILSFAWPFSLVNLVQGMEPAGDIDGRVQFESTPGSECEISLYRSGHARAPRMRTPVEVNDDGVYDCLALGQDVYWMYADCDGFKSTLETVAVQPGVSTTVSTIYLDEGRHDVTPASEDFLSRASLDDIRFHHHDPDGLAGLGWFPFIFLELPGGGYWNVAAKGTDLLEVEQLDSDTLVLKLDSQLLLQLLGQPAEVALWWVMAETATGKVRVSEGIYRFDE